MNGLELSKFKKVSSDKMSTTLKHANGHILKIAHGKLEPHLKKQLDKLPIHKADGGDVSQDEDDNQYTNDPSNVTTEQKPQGVNININAQPQQPVAPTPAPQQVQATVQPPQQVEQTAQQPVPQNNLATQGSGLGASAVPASTNTEVSQEQNTEPMPAMQEPQQQETPKEAEANIQPPVNVKQEMSQEDKAFEHDLNNGHITPQAYSDLFAKKSTMGKIGTLFGLILGGAGAGLTHTENPILQMMNNEIKNDLDAQVQSKNNAQNFIKLNQMNQMNMAQIHKMVQDGQLTEAQANVATADANSKAYTLANMQMNRTVLHKLTQDMQKLPIGSPQRQQAEQTLAMMYQAVNTENFNLADKAAVASGYYKTLFGQPGEGSGEQGFQKKTSGMRALGPEGEKRAVDLEAKHFPGIKGQASIPLSGEDRSSITSGMDFDQKLHRFMDWTGKHSGDLNPADRKAGQALAAELQGAYRQATHGGVYKEGEQNFISKLIDSTPTKFFNEIRVLPSLRAIASENKARMNNLVKSKGFEGYEGASGPKQPKQEQEINDMMGNGPETTEIERKDPKSGKIVVYDAKTKKPLRWK